MDNKDALVEAMYKAVMARTDKESDKATVLALEIAKDMTIGEVQECQKTAISLINQKRHLDAIIERAMDKPVIH
jgi:hypothetical protein